MTPNTINGGYPTYDIAPTNSQYYTTRGLDCYVCFGE
jgi:hypothetical protein